MSSPSVSFTSRPTVATATSTSVPSSPNRATSGGDADDLLPVVAGSTSPATGPSGSRRPQQPGPTRMASHSHSPQIRTSPIVLSDYLELRNYTDPTTRKNCTWIATRQVCPPSSFCPLNTTSHYPCPTSFMCLHDTAHPSYCCKGFYCRTPDTVQICPEHHYCPVGSTAPIPCGWFFSHCPIGSDRPTRPGVFLVFAAVCLIAYVAFVIRDYLSLSNTAKASQVDVGAHGEEPHLKMSASDKTLSSTISAHEPSSEFTSSTATVKLPQASRWGLFGASASTTAVHETAIVKDEEVVHFSIRFEGLTRTLPNGTVILKDVTGEMRPAKLCAIMGPSGSGKSTLLHCLAGKSKRTGGKVFLNDYQDEMQRYSKLVGFVPQEDIMIRDLTVLDILRHSALMRMPAYLSQAEKEQRVQDLISYLGMSHVQHSIIGDERVRGVSGGQRKRVNIGMELVAAPSILMLDEQKTRCRGCHPLPSQQCIDLFDDLILLGAGGRVVYTGSRRYAMSYFTNLGFVKPPKQSEPEFYLDVIAGKVPLPWNPSFRAVDLFDYWNAFTNGISIHEARQMYTDISNRARDRDAMAQRRGVSLPAKIFAAVMDPIHHAREYIVDVAEEIWCTISTLGVPDQVRETPGPHVALALCTRRAAQQVWRTWTAFFIEIAVHMAAGSFISLAAQENEFLGRFPKEITAANTFGLERVVYWRDVSTGMPTFPYFLGKVFVDLPRVVMGGIMFSVALMFLWPYRGEWWPLMVAVVALYFAAFSMGYFISTIALPSSTGIMATSFSLFWALVLGGVIPAYSEVLKQGTVYNVFRPLWDLSAPRYFIEATFLLEARGRMFEELKSSEIYTDLGYDRDGYWNAVVNIVVIGFLWQTMALLGMKLTAREKQK
ncbi:hypothetical protein BCR44DRAFT_1425381 [Catenaria anguillulae PL171]|uniref:ABC transporter domain-containing protein n=1 Tax=Catenaria anguillulae PL171 TaxID=765915 RepID=A0A1Y2I172_9FUNG|nr:hypothetical protein BCR44DRAFT_1425381 [Catenaria anguillulae PL171]